MAKRVVTYVPSQTQLGNWVQSVETITVEDVEYLPGGGLRILGGDEFYVYGPSAWHSVYDAEQ